MTISHFPRDFQRMFDTGLFPSCHSNIWTSSYLEEFLFAVIWSRHFLLISMSSKWREQLNKSLLRMNHFESDSSQMFNCSLWTRSYRDTQTDIWWFERIISNVLVFFMETINSHISCRHHIRSNDLFNRIFKHVYLGLLSINWYFLETYTIVEQNSTVQSNSSSQVISPCIFTPTTMHRFTRNNWIEFSFRSFACDVRWKIDRMLWNILDRSVWYENISFVWSILPACDRLLTTNNWCSRSRNVAVEQNYGSKDSILVRFLEINIR